MHRAFYLTRPEAGAVVHLHSTMATAVACLPDVDPAAPIPPLTPYFVMRVGGRLPVVPYYKPGDPAMEPAIVAAARDAKAVLLANHGPVVSGGTLLDAVYAAEELEEAARLYMLLRGGPMRLLTPPQVAALSVGAIGEHPVGRNGALSVRTTCSVGLTVDHRAADGADAGRFLSDLSALLGAPEQLLRPRSQHSG